MKRPRPRPTVDQRKTAYRFAATLTKLDRNLSASEAATLTEAVRKAAVQIQRPAATDRRKDGAAALLQRVAVRIGAVLDLDTLTYSWPARNLAPAEAPCYEA